MSMHSCEVATALGDSNANVYGGDYKYDIVTALAHNGSDYQSNAAVGLYDGFTVADRCWNIRTPPNIYAVRLNLRSTWQDQV